METDDSQQIVAAIQNYLANPNSGEFSTGKLRRRREANATVSYDLREVARSVDIRRLDIESVDAAQALVRLDARIKVEVERANGKRKPYSFRLSGPVRLMHEPDGWKVFDTPVDRSRSVTGGIAESIDGEAVTGNVRVRAVAALTDSTGVALIIDIESDEPVVLSHAAIRRSATAHTRWIPASISARRLPAGTTRVLVHGPVVSRLRRGLLPPPPQALRLLLGFEGGPIIDLGIGLGAVASVVPARPRSSFPLLTRFGRFGRLGAFGVVVVAFGLLSSRRGAGWLMLVCAAIWGYSILRLRGIFSRSHEYVAVTAMTAAIGAALVLTNGGVPFRRCGAADGPSARRVADGFATALASSNRSRADGYLGYFPDSKLPHIVGAPLTPDAIASALASGVHFGREGLCHTNCFGYQLGSVNQVSGEEFPTFAVGVTCHSGSWKVDEVGS